MVYPDTCEIPPHTKREKKQLLPPLVVNYLARPAIYIAAHNWRRAARYLPVVHPCRRGAAGSIIDPGWASGSS